MSDKEKRELYLKKMPNDYLDILTGVYKEGSSDVPPGQHWFEYLEAQDEK